MQVTGFPDGTKKSMHHPHTIYRSGTAKPGPLNPVCLVAGSQKVDFNYGMMDPL